MYVSLVKPQDVKVCGMESVCNQKDMLCRKTYTVIPLYNAMVGVHDIKARNKWGAL